MPEQTPSIGRVVHYYHPVERDNDGKLKVNPDGAVVARVVSPAIIQEVDEKETSKVLLFVMSNFGGTVGRVPASFRGEGVEVLEDDGYWIYPPKV